MRAAAALLLVLVHLEQRQREVLEQSGRAAVPARVEAAVENLSEAAATGELCPAPAVQAGPCAACESCLAPEPEGPGWGGVVAGHLASALIGRGAGWIARRRDGEAVAHREVLGSLRKALLGRGVRA